MPSGIYIRTPEIRAAISAAGKGKRLGNKNSLGSHRYTHGMYGTRTYTSWRKMKERCNNPNATDYYLYGERGITVCDRWNGKRDFPNFYADMGERPEGKTLDRVDVNGNYEPANCRWATPKEQRRNQRDA